MRGQAGILLSFRYVILYRKKKVEGTFFKGDQI